MRRLQGDAFAEALMATPELQALSSQLEQLGFAGPSGTGKTTLLEHLIAFTYDVDSPTAGAAAHDSAAQRELVR